MNIHKNVISYLELLTLECCSCILLFLYPARAQLPGTGPSTAPSPKSYSGFTINHIDL